MNRQKDADENMQELATYREGALRQGSSLAPAVISPLLLMPFALFGPNALLACFACLVLGIGIALLWRPGEPPILLFIFGYQWLQSAAGPFYGNFTDLRLDDLAERIGNHDLACFLMLTGVLVLALGMRLTVGPNSFHLIARIREFVGSRPIGFWLRLYIASWIVGALCATVAWSAGGFMQPLLALSQIKWAAFVMLTFATFAIPGRPKSIWLAVFTFEFVFAIGGFFSSFKDIFFYALFGLAACSVRLDLRKSIALLVGGALLLVLGVVWSAVKEDYRKFANEGSHAQIVLVGNAEKVHKLSSLVANMDRATLEYGIDALVRRTMYYEFFGVAIVNVPDNVPHSGGAIWGDAIVRLFTPRLLFPDKTAVNDSELTNQYTGLSVTSFDKGASISLGYMAEAYVDFGPLLMFLPIALLGAAIGWCYRWLLSQPGRDGVIGAALSTFTIMQAYAAETSVLKMIPALVLCIFACLVVLKFLAPLIWGVEKKPAMMSRIRRAPTG